MVERGKGVPTLLSKDARVAMKTRSRTVESFQLIGIVTVGAAWC
jgi:hypothetical protein